jgi:hypothetical protein
MSIYCSRVTDKKRCNRNWTSHIAFGPGHSTTKATIVFQFHARSLSPLLSTIILHPQFLHQYCPSSQSISRALFGLIFAGLDLLLTPLIVSEPGQVLHAAGSLYAHSHIHQIPPCPFCRLTCSLTDPHHISTQWAVDQHGNEKLFQIIRWADLLSWFFLACQ